MAHSVFIDGAEGTTGLEIRERLAGRAEFEVLSLPENLRKDAQARRDALTSSDFAILCLPDDASREAASWTADSKTRLIDASSAHRVADGWTYGFPELTGANEVANAARISNPGCYPTGFLALVAPLVKAGLLPADWPYTVNAVSGFSGGGKALIKRFEDDPELAWRGYGYGLGHKHLPEMRHYAGIRREPVFAPSVIPAIRGMVVEVPLQLDAMASPPAVQALTEALAEFYSGSPIVTVLSANETPSEILLNSAPDPWDGLELSVVTSANGTQARLIAQLDNLGKGASGAAVQSLNLMAGLPETTGLRL